MSDTKKKHGRRPGPVSTALAVAGCKGARGALRLMHRGGTALPGKVAMKLEPKILNVTSRGMDIIVVTGTNGKTTTCRMLEHAMTGAGRDTLANKSGANLLSGVTAEFTASATLGGRPTKKYAIIECDEGALRQVVPRIHPKVICVTNLFRDQLDRYGEVMNTRNLIYKGIQKVPDAILCLNADDSLVASLADGVPNKVIWYGIDCPVGDQKDVEISDAKHCIRCGEEYVYDYHTYAHLGGFRCPHCGYRRPDTDVAVTSIEKIAADGSTVKIRTRRGAEPREVKIALPAVYNVYNAVGAACAYLAAGYDEEEILSSLSDVHSSFGRMETFQLDDTRVQMILVKNPAGCNQALEYLRSLGEDYTAVFCLNDRTADGHDISWIWDADFEKVCHDPHVKHILVMGDRADDMALRLKYADAPEEIVEFIPDDAAMLERMRKSDLPVFVLPNYTSMLSLRRAISEATGRGEFWKG